MKTVMQSSNPRKPKSVLCYHACAEERTVAEENPVVDEKSVEGEKTVVDEKYQSFE